MSKRLLFFLMVTMILFSSCTISRSYRGRIELPVGTSVETAKEIVNNIMNDGFIEKISNKFPNFNPVKNPKKHGIFLYWGYMHGKSGPEDVHIRFVINYVGKLDNRDEIIEYGTSIVEKYIREYFKNKTEYSGQPPINGWGNCKEIVNWLIS